jgi:hypothetical protein
LLDIKSVHFCQESFSKVFIWHGFTSLSNTKVVSPRLKALVPYPKYNICFKNAVSETRHVTDKKAPISLPMQNTYARLDGLVGFLRSVPHYTFQAMMERVWYLYQHFEYLQFQNIQHLIMEFDDIVKQMEDFIHSEMTRNLISRYCTAYSTQLKIQSIDSQFCDLSIVLIFN